MIHHEDRELEQTLRSLPTAVPPDALRRRILGAAGTSGKPRPAWKRGVVYAFCLMALLALDLWVECVQSARLSRLMGDGRQGVSAPASALAALQHRREMLAMLDRGEMP